MFDGDILSLKHRITTTTAKNCKLQLHRKFHPNNYVFFVENFSSLPSKKLIMERKTFLKMKALEHLEIDFVSHVLLKHRSGVSFRRF